MQKLNNKGYMLIETLIVSTFVAGILLFLFIQFSNLNKNYEYAFKYNTVEGLYAIEDIKNYILQDSDAYKNIEQYVISQGYIDITDCLLFSYKTFCKELINQENINTVLVTYNNFKIKNINFTIEDENLKNFIDKINPSDNQKYRLIAKFNNNTFATIRFGE